MSTIQESDQIVQRRANLEAPNWLWSSVVDLLWIHERAYLEHCRRYALAAEAIPVGLTGTVTATSA